MKNVNIIVDLNGCDVWKIMESSVKSIDGSACGIVLSPKFPGIVEPGVWTWTFEGIENYYFLMYVYNVGGPGLGGDGCDDFFQGKD